MRYTEKTSQVQNYVPLLRAVFFARHARIASCVVLATTLMFAPHHSLGETFLSLPSESSEGLTFNYFLVNTKSGPHHEKGTASQDLSVHRGQKESTSHAPTATRETHSVSSFQDNSHFVESAAPISPVEATIISRGATHSNSNLPIEENSIIPSHSALTGGPSTPAVAERHSVPQSTPYREEKGNEVSSAMRDYPTSLKNETPAQKNLSPFDSDYSEANAKSDKNPNQGSDSTKHSYPSFPNSQTQASTTLSPKLRFNADGLSDLRSRVVLARFARVFDPTWEAPRYSQPAAYGHVALVLNESVEKSLKYFQHGIPERFQTYLDRFHHYQDLVEPVFRELGLPLELMYLSIVESGFNPRAFSRSRASGPWQFMKGTGRMYGLDVDWYLDERRDPIKSTVAAAHHLRDLYDQFGSWPLALAAYNAGSGKISRAIKKTGTRDFWTIRQSRHIKLETKEYVPRFIAATLIAQNPTAYGFNSPSGDRHKFEEVLITKPVHLSSVTQLTGIAIEELKRLNPELRRSIVPNLSGSGYYLKVPFGMASLVEEHQPKLATWTQSPPPQTEWYQVRRGDSLSVVAKQFGMKVSQLKRMNNLSSNIIRVGTKLRVRGGIDDDYSDGTEITWYRVRSGDSLGSIATRFRTSVKSLMRLNNLSSHIIYPGDRLRVKGTPGADSPNNNKSKWYKVKKGDSLWTIARQFRVSVNDLRTLNNLSSSIIQAGHMLMVSP
jgi:membrane-bound lytic murein transglycosylase D